MDTSKAVRKAQEDLSDKYRKRVSELQAEKDSLVDQNRKLELSNRFLNTEMKVEESNRII